ncbi:hypothetical protein BDE02_05G165200 [Populus trichocarpa]|nr:hypothetical protein BDE02_05G165200 [Populus trichocarpa]
MFAARPSTMTVFPTPGSPTRQGLFFLLLQSICVTRSICFRLPTTWSSLPCKMPFKEAKVSVIVASSDVTGSAKTCEKEKSGFTSCAIFVKSVPYLFSISALKCCFSSLSINVNSN